MGLDFGLYYKKKNEQIPEEDNAYFDWMNKHELCYGRKSWELVHILNLPVDDEDEDPIVNKEDWDNLISAMKSFLNGKDSSYFSEIGDCYAELEKYYELDIEELGVSPDPDVVNAIIQYEVWYDKTFNDETPTLGYDFALGYLQDFYNADKQVQKYLNDDEYEVRAYISF